MASQHAVRIRLKRFESDDAVTEQPGKQGVPSLMYRCAQDLEPIYICAPTKQAMHNPPKTASDEVHQHPQQDPRAKQDQDLVNRCLDCKTDVTHDSMKERFHP